MILYARRRSPGVHAVDEPGRDRVYGVDLSPGGDRARPLLVRDQRALLAQPQHEHHHPHGRTRLDSRHPHLVRARYWSVTVRVILSFRLQTNIRACVLCESYDVHEDASTKFEERFAADSICKFK